MIKIVIQKVYKFFLIFIIIWLFLESLKKTSQHWHTIYNKELNFIYRNSNCSYLNKLHNENTIRKIKLIMSVPDNFSLFDTLNNSNKIRPGGHWWPLNCKPLSKLAVIIPYKDREYNLKLFLYNMHSVFKRQELNYSIYVIEQINNDQFNKGILMNAGFLEIFEKRSNISKNLLGDYTYNCFVFHDVDLLPTGFLIFFL